jgi:hypothetical protein
MTDQEKANYDKARDLRNEVDEWVDRAFNFQQLEVYEKMADSCLFEHIQPDLDDPEDENGENYPMWNTFFEFRYASSEEDIQAAQESGFGIINSFESFETTLFVSGCGYSFYSVHWIPLYLKLFPSKAEKYQGVNYQMV